MSLKDKPVGGTWTGPTGCGSLGLVHKTIINFQVLQKPKFLGLCAHCELQGSSELGTGKQCISDASAIAWGNVRLQTKGAQTDRKVPPPFHHHRIGRIVMWYETQQKRSLLGKRCFHTPLLPTKCLLGSGELGDHHQRGEYLLSINKTAHLSPKTEDIIVYR